MDYCLKRPISSWNHNNPMLRPEQNGSLTVITRRQPRRHGRPSITPNQTHDFQGSTLSPSRIKGHATPLLIEQSLRRFSLFMGQCDLGVLKAVYW
ncbi:hypothetical protein CEXT_677311 [Caerostris extrusa]|uniref:Uncharacterized protein n=1 Tax=Caerostris extrusa TaxID=172846 RepID=A0AAV4U6A9_CAEEX|nr:hypothetical protein CEXT_677311 [Caerostris extrusa]